MNTFFTSVFLMLAVSASAEKIWEPSDSAQLNAAAFEEELSNANTPSLNENSNRDGSSYCTYSPDYSCYKSGRPSCCGRNRGRDCPKQEPRCDNRRPNPRPTRKPTRAPTSNNRRPTSECVDDERPRADRNGERFRFNLVKSDAQCVDNRDRNYEWGEYNKVDNFSACAELCVNNTPESLVTGGTFRGYDYDCDSRLCRCLYDAGTLDSRNSGRFERTNRNGTGEGSISDTTQKRSYYCAKLVGAEFLDMVAEA